MTRAAVQFVAKEGCVMNVGKSRFRMLLFLFRMDEEDGSFCRRSVYLRDQRSICMHQYNFSFEIKKAYSCALV